MSLITFSVFLLLLGISNVEALTVKICVPSESGDCNKFLSNCTNAVGLADNDDLTFICVAGGSAEKCVSQIESGEAHLTTLDGAEVLRANHEHHIVPLIVEDTGDGIMDGAHYSVAVVNREFCTPTTTLADLEGVRSCHAGYRRSAGWIVPVGTLLMEVPSFESTATRPRVDDDAELVAQFFGTVCAPRTSENGPKNGGEGGVTWDPLCTGCRGDCTENDQYYDHSGAFRCLTEGMGDVAFVKHTTVPQYALDGSMDPVLRQWSEKPMEDFQLLCRDGGCKDVTEFEECHLSLAAARALVTSSALGHGGQDEETGLAIQAAILKASENTDFLQATTEMASDFLWSDDTIGLLPIESGIESYLPPEFQEVYTEFEMGAGTYPRRQLTGTYCATSNREMRLCRQMVETAESVAPEINWGCLKQNDTAACIEAIHIGAADWMTVSPEDAYQATHHGLTTILAENGELGDGYDHYVVAAVTSDFCENNPDARVIDLQGKRSCHGTYRDSVGWDIPIGRMASLGILESVKEQANVENDAETVKAFFSTSCAPVRKGEGPYTMRNGNQVQWVPLCQPCGDSCDENSRYFGDDGALQCLLDDIGDVAFVQHTTVVEAEREDLRLLCLTRNGCASVDDYRNCNLGLVAARSVVVRDAPHYKATFKEALTTVVQDDAFSQLVLDAESNPDNLIFRPTTTEFVELESTETFLGSSIDVYRELEDLTSPNGTLVKICIPYAAEAADILECEEIFAAANVPGVQFECTLGGSTEACMQQLFNGEAHLTTLDGGDVFRAHNIYGIVPLIREVGEDGTEGTYYAVAVVNAEFCSDSTTLADLQGLRSCHTGYRKMAGWRIPVGTLISKVEAFNETARKREIIEDDAELVAGFFDQVCAPRISGGGPQNTEDGEGTLWKKLCTGCKGNCSPADQYYDYPGAFRCLTENKGDVAFIKHTTVLDYASDGQLDFVMRAWATKPKSHFRLVCRDGGCAKVDEYENCHLALVPSHAIVGATALGEQGQLSAVGRVIQDGLVAAASNPGFLRHAKGFIRDFPFSASTQDAIKVEGGYRGYVTPEADIALTAFADLINGETRFNPGHLAIFCSYTAEQHAACQQNVGGIWSELEPSFMWECLQEDSTQDCYEAINRGRAQFMAASPREALDGYLYHGLFSIAGEVIGPEKRTTVYSLAVTHSDNCREDVYLTNFEGNPACFSGFGSASGWEAPVSVMISQGLISSVDKTDLSTRAAHGINDFFSLTCAPHDRKSETAWDNLCAGCGDDCTLEGTFAGPFGALECMKQSESSIAITDSSVLLDRGATEGLRLLCPHKRGCYDVNLHPSCNFGETPTDVILVDSSADTIYVTRLLSTLINASSGRSYASVLRNTRQTGHLVALLGGTDVYLSKYARTVQALNLIENGSDGQP